jgi:hypothetical protein
MTVTTDLIFAMRVMHLLDDVGREAPLHRGVVLNLLELSLASCTRPLNGFIIDLIPSLGVS